MLSEHVASYKWYLIVATDIFTYVKSEDQGNLLILYHTLVPSLSVVKVTIK